MGVDEGMSMSVVSETSTARPLPFRSDEIGRGESSRIRSGDVGADEEEATVVGVSRSGLGTRRYSIGKPQSRSLCRPSETATMTIKSVSETKGASADAPMLTLDICQRVQPACRRSHVWIHLGVRVYRLSGHLFGHGISLKFLPIIRHELLQLLDADAEF